MNTSALHYTAPPALAPSRGARHVTWTIAGVLLALVLQACGSSDTFTSGLSNTSASQITNGVVTGFGSVVVDGVEIEDSQSKIHTELADGSTKNSTLQLGQRVRVSHGKDGSASKITIDAAVIGTVSTVNTNAKTLTVAAQVVRVNTTDTALPITYFGGSYNALADINTGDVVEVHGSPVLNGTTGKYEVQATRIHKQTGVTGFRVMGTVASLNTTAKTFALNGLTVNYASAALRPNGTTLTNGQSVVAFANTNNALTGTTLTTSQVKIYTSDETISDTRSTAQVSGVVSNYNAGVGWFTLQGLTINVGNVTPTPANSTIANNAYVVVTGTVNTQGTIDATTIKVRQASVESDFASVKLIGPISSFDDATKTMVVRNVVVDFDEATNGCTTALADGVVVNVIAQQQTDTDVVLAKTITCQLPTGTIIENYLGSPSAINLTNQSFTLTVTGASGSTTTKSVQWNDLTTFDGISAGTLSSAPSGKLMVEGYTANGVLVARSVRVLGEMGGDRFRGDNKATERQTYRREKPRH